MDLSNLSRAWEQNIIDFFSERQGPYSELIKKNHEISKMHFNVFSMTF